MKSFQIKLNDPEAPEGQHKAIFMNVESPYYQEIDPILQRLNEVTNKPAEWQLHRTFVDGKEVACPRSQNAGINGGINDLTT